MDEEQKQIEEDIKKHERNIKDDDAKKVPRPTPLIQIKFNPTRMK